MEEGDVTRLVEAIGILNDSVNKLEKTIAPPTSGPSASASINTNGMYVSVMCVLILLIICLFQNRDIVEMQRRYDRMQDYLNVIYMQAPHLKPKEMK